jgi:hypothetical protein
MSEPNTSPMTPPSAPPATVKPSAKSRFFSALQLPIALAVAIAAVAYLLWPEGHKEDESNPGPVETEVVKLVGQHRLTISPGTPLEKKLEVAEVRTQKTSAPLLKVTGSVVARLAPAPSQGDAGGYLPKEGSPAAEPQPKGGTREPAASPSSKVEGRWDFNAPELASAYADWLKARNDVPYLEAQRVNIFKLAEANAAAKKEVVDRLEKLVTAGTDPVKDLVTAKADLLQSQIQGEKDKHEAQTNVNNAKRTLATLERQLFLAGIDPALLAQETSSMAIVVAEVPEVRIGLARSGEPCTALFYAYPERQFTGVVGSMSPAISKERRTLRVFFQVNDPNGLLKPGMYADVGLGTQPRDTLFVPAEGVLHVGQFDYVLVADGPNQWKITKVKAGEQQGKLLEILQGLRPGDRVIGPGAILLKPYVVEDVTQ